MANEGWGMLVFKNLNKKKLLVSGTLGRGIYSSFTVMKIGQSSE